MNVLVTRAAHQNQGFVDALINAGHQPIIMPVLAITKLHELQPNYWQRLQEQWQQSFDKAIFVSANAANIACELMPQPLSADYFAIGSNTATIIKSYLSRHNANQTITIAPPPYRTESLLTLEELSQLKQQRIIIFSGLGGRPLLQEQLKLRGADVHLCELYKRVEATELRTTLQQLTLIPQVLTAMSVDTLTLLHKALVATGLQSWLSIPIIVASPRVGEVAAQIGFQRVIDIQYPNAQQLVAAIQTL